VEIDGKRQVRTVEQPFDTPAITTVPAKELMEKVLAGAGASLPRRDPVDTRLIEHVRNRTGKLINSQREVGGWPELKSAAAPVDVDNDGIPDEWEMRQGLNPRDPSDGAKLAKSGYSNLEEYLNGIGK
jgi:hypothetical protein